MAYTHPLDALKTIEEVLGNNLQWLDDKLDLSIRQGDKETIMRLSQLNEAWILACKVIKQHTTNIEREAKNV